MKTPTIGIGILSWKAHDTLVNSLQSYSLDFLEFFDKRLIYFSDISDKDKAIAREYGWDFAGGPNEGIAGGMKRLAENLDTDYVLLLQNDNPLIEDWLTATRHVQRAVNMLSNGKADLARMRHRWQVGEGFADVTKYLKYFPLFRMDKQFDPDHHDEKKLNFRDSIEKKLLRLFRIPKAHRLKGRSVFIEKFPNDLFPKYIKREGQFFIIDSAVLDFTDQCLLISRDLWLNVFVPFIEANPASTRSSNGFQAPELCINKSKWWRKSHFKILQGQGIFTHARYDGSFRPEHHTNKETIL